MECKSPLIKEGKLKYMFSHQLYYLRNHTGQNNHETIYKGSARNSEFIRVWECVTAQK